MSSIGLLVHHDREEAWQLARDVTSWLLERGHGVCLPDADAAKCGLGELAVQESELPAGLDLVISMGGDGSILRAVELVSDDDVPVLGVNVGQLGYLTQVEPESLRMALKRFLAGAYEVEERMRLALHISSIEEGDTTASALNEAALEKTDSGHTVRLGVAFDGEYFTSYVADGLILATPTGSTAYSFSVRGPIVAPTHRAQILLPVSPHMLFDRAMVLEPDTNVRVEVEGGRPASLWVDGRSHGRLGPGDAVECKASHSPARLVTFGPRDFHRILRTKFGLAER